MRDHWANYASGAVGYTAGLLGAQVFHDITHGVPPVMQAGRYLGDLAAGIGTGIVATNLTREGVNLTERTFRTLGAQEDAMHDRQQRINAAYQDGITELNSFAATGNQAHRNNVHNAMDRLREIAGRRHLW
ncbi:MAG: hypothetical protein HYY37_02610 [Candidatus Aenigmarchaeota archaeon]|nr:hypothetical protein [Candidatus Aenigmarchaeota archaeon]